MQVPAADPDGFVTYDELSGPDLDAARWSPARLLLPTGSEHIPLDPNAELAVGGGEVRVTIPRFSLSHHQFQSAESPKYLIFSTSQFAPPPDRPATRWPTGDRQARPLPPAAHVRDRGACRRRLDLRAGSPDGDVGQGDRQDLQAPST
jgi:hypothetical protein